MTSTELIIALAMMIAITSFFITTENKLAVNMAEISAKIETKNNEMHCAVAANNYYAHSGGILKGKIGCFANKGNFLSKPTITDFLGAKKIIIETESHYGKRNFIFG